MSFSAIVSVETLRDAIEPVSALVDECKLRTGEDGLSITAVDPANVGMVDMTLKAGAFEAIEADEGTLGINLERFEDVLSMGDKGDLVHLALVEDDRVLHIQIAELSYTLALIDPDTIRQEPDIPDLDLPASVAFEGAAFDRAVRACDLVSNHISIQGDPDRAALVFGAQGDTDDVELVLDEEEIVDADVPEAVESMFSLDYLKDMATPIGSETIVSMELGSEMPVKFRYQAAANVSVTNMLAPRIQSN